MINTSEIAQRMARLAAEMHKAQEAFQAHRINDYGEASGFCTEAEIIGDDAINQLGSLTRRFAMNLAALEEKLQIPSGGSARASSTAFRQRTARAFSGSSRGRNKSS
jgi:hypothetical protein